MDSYQVVRPFPGVAVGAILTDADFNNPDRARRLVEQRYLARVERTEGMQPTAAALLTATVRQLDGLLSQVADVCVLQAAIAQEPRESAKAKMQKHLAAMKGGQSHELTN